ncbi:MAG: polysaccharide export protein EpsE [Burkholderiales bacterium]|nr:polysaccharide export protein EpsE [Burkholderiales bacterium]
MTASGRLVRLWTSTLLLAGLWLAAATAHAQVVRPYLIGAGDVIKIVVFQNPDMTTEARVGDNGLVTFPLIGAVDVGNGTTVQAEQKIATALKAGGFVLKPQVSITVVQFRSRQVSVIGFVNRPGRVSLEDQTLRLADVLALAGGTNPNAADTVYVLRNRPGKDAKEERITVDLDAAVRFNDLSQNLEILPGDTIYVPRESNFYIYGQVGRPGMFRIERGMTVVQAISAAGGITLRGTEKGITLRRKDSGGRFDTLNAGLLDKLQADDVIFVKESVF